MEHLPLRGLTSILAFTLGYTEDLVPNKREIPLDNLKTLALVYQCWYNVIDEMVARFQLATLNLNFHAGSRSEFLKIRRQILERGSRVVDLRVHMAISSSRSSLYSKAPALDDLFGWKSLFQHFLNVQRLDLSMVPFTSPQLKGLVQAAATYCPNLESLILSGGKYTGGEMTQEKSDNIDLTLKTVYEGLEKWRTTGRQTGLRQLAIPKLNKEKTFCSCAEFIENVTSFCPKVEYLDGYKQSLIDRDCLTCRQTWPLTLEMRETFNARYVNLREFDWVVAPFGDPFFRAFGGTAKPHLKKLTFGVNMLWNWEESFRCCDDAVSSDARASGTNVVRPGYGVNATDARSALVGCPGLEELNVNLYHPLGVFLDLELLRCEPERFPRTEVLSLEMFGDEFMQSLVINCPMVKCVTITEVAKRFNDIAVY